MGQGVRHLPTGSLSAVATGGRAQSAVTDADSGSRDAADLKEGPNLREVLKNRVSC